MEVKTAELVHYLKAQTVSATWLEKLKIRYRPLICPFNDLLQLVKPDAKVLDIGCGAGQFLTLVAAFKNAKQLGGLEISNKLVKQAKVILAPFENQLPIVLEPFDGLHFPPFLAEFDTVFLIDVLHHIPVKDQLQFLKNIYHGVAPGATLIIKDIDAASPWVYFNKIHDLLLAGEIGHELPVLKLIQHAAAIGFRVQSITERRMFGYPHVTLTLLK